MVGLARIFYVIGKTSRMSLFMGEPGLAPLPEEQERDALVFNEVSLAKHKTIEIIQLHRQKITEQLNLDDINTPEMFEEKVLKSLVKLGKLTEAKEELKKFYERSLIQVQEQGYLPQDFSVLMIELFISLEMFEEATDLLNSLREGFVSLVAGAGLPFVVSCFIKMGKDSVAKEVFFEHEKTKNIKIRILIIFECIIKINIRFNFISI